MPENPDLKNPSQFFEMDRNNSDLLAKQVVYTESTALPSVLAGLAEIAVVLCQTRLVAAKQMAILSTAGVAPAEILAVRQLL